MIRIYHAKGTRSVRNIWLCEELGLPYEAVAIDFSPAYRQSPDWRAMHPQGKVPVMTDGGVTIFESCAINQYLLDRYGEGRLQPPPGTTEAARYQQWCWFAESSFARPLGDWVHHERLRPPEQRIPGVVADARLRAEPCLAATDGHLESNAYLLGNEFTNADIIMAWTLMVAKLLGLLTEASAPAAWRYMADLESRSGYQVAMAA